MATFGLQAWLTGCSQKWPRALTRFSLPRVAGTQSITQPPSIGAAPFQSGKAEMTGIENGHDNSPHVGWWWVERILGEQITNSILLMAVPKKRTTHSKKRKRMTHKYLSRRTTMLECEFCKEWKRPHFYCTPNCPGRRQNSL